MPRKVKQPLPPADSEIRQPEQQPFEVPGSAPEPQPQAQPAPKRGRPSKADKAAKEEAERMARALRPEQTVTLTVAVLGMVQLAFKGDEPTKDEVFTVNEPLCAVVNKYGGTFPYFEEAMLVLALVSVGGSMRRRGQVKRETARGASGDRAEGEREESASAAFFEGSAALSGN